MIVFAMAGLSSRFFAAGYAQPKYVLKYGGSSVFRHVVAGFERLFGHELLVFVCRSEFDTPGFIERELRALGLPSSSYEIVVLSETTPGQATTVSLALQALRPRGDECLTIFNVDTIRHQFDRVSQHSRSGAGYLEVVRAPGDHWSFVLPAPSDSGPIGQVAAVAEKKRISDLCSTGLYHFSSVDLFRDLYDDFCRSLPDSPAPREHYVAPLYQIGLDRGLEFTYVRLRQDQVEFCGTPEEYRTLVGIHGP